MFNSANILKIIKILSTSGLSFMVLLKYQTKLKSKLILNMGRKFVNTDAFPHLNNYSTEFQFVQRKTKNFETLSQT